MLWKRRIRGKEIYFAIYLFLLNKTERVAAMVVLDQGSVKNTMKIGINEVAIIILIILPFIYLMTNRTIRCERKPNRAERRRKWVTV